MIWGICTPSWRYMFLSPKSFERCQGVKLNGSIACSSHVLWDSHKPGNRDSQSIRSSASDSMYWMSMLILWTKESCELYNNRIRIHVFKKWANILCKDVICIPHCSYCTAREDISAAAVASNPNQTIKPPFTASLCVQFEDVTGLIPSSWSFLDRWKSVCRPNKDSKVKITVPHCCCV